MRDYFYLPEDELIGKIKALGWDHDPNFRSTWRADCYVNVLRQYYYQRLLGFTDQDVQYAHQTITDTTMMKDTTAEIMVAETTVATN